MSDSATRGQPAALPELQIHQILLEDLEFGHYPDFLARDIHEKLPDPPGLVNVQVEMAPGNNAIVRLRLENTDVAGPYRYRLSYIVLFSIRGELPPDIDKRLAVTGANMVMPFARELVANITSRGRFGVRWINPINFNQLITEQAAKEALAAQQPSK